MHVHMCITAIKRLYATSWNNDNDSSFYCCYYKNMSCVAVVVFIVMCKLDALLADLRVSVPVRQPLSQQSVNHEISSSTNITAQSGLLPSHGPVVSYFSAIKQTLQLPLCTFKQIAKCHDSLL